MEFIKISREIIKIMIGPFHAASIASIVLGNNINILKSNDLLLLNNIYFANDKYAINSQKLLTVLTILS